MEVEFPPRNPTGAGDPALVIFKQETKNMSRAYSMTVMIENFNKPMVEEIIKAAKIEWDFEDWWSDPDKVSLQGGGEGALREGEREDEFADRLAKAIFIANSKFCDIDITAIYLENLPFDEYCFDEDDYLRLIGEVAKNE